MCRMRAEHPSEHLLGPKVWAWAAPGRGCAWWSASPSACSRYDWHATHKSRACFAWHDAGIEGPDKRATNLCLISIAKRLAVP